MKDDDVMIGGRVMRIVLLSPPVRSESPFAPAVVRAEEINSADPDTIRIDRINRNRARVPADVFQAFLAQTALAVRCVEGIREQRLIEIVVGLWRERIENRLRLPGI